MSGLLALAAFEVSCRRRLQAGRQRGEEKPPIFCFLWRIVAFK